MKYGFIILFLFCLSVCGVTAKAQDSAGGHHFGAFYGYGPLTGSTKNATVTGFRYEMKQFIWPQTGFGGLYDTISADDSQYRIGLIVYYYPFLDFIVGAGPTIRFRTGDNKNMLYYEIGYSFHSGSLYLTPLYTYEFVGSEFLLSIGARLSWAL